jgi:hypothetical protein
MLSPQIIENHLQGRSVQSPISGLPGCSKSDQGKSDNQDPTWATGTSNYTDGEGVNVGNDCTTGHNSNHCWTDYFLVGTTVSYDNWYEAIGDINCSQNGTCAQAISQLQQTCKSTEWSVSETISTEFEFEIVKVGLSVTVTAGQTYQSCNGNTTMETCTWTDGGCHSVWAAQRVTNAHGYTRRSCVSPTSDTNANMPNSPKRSDGFYTRGMMDFSVPLSDGNSISCDGQCGSTYNPGPLPAVPGGGALQPWPTS